MAAGRRQGSWRVDAPETWVGFTQGAAVIFNFQALKQASASPRRRKRPEDVGALSLGNNEGAGKAGCPVHPQPACSGR
jgi:hypothetical protein